jgi:hypothetical protein
VTKEELKQSSRVCVFQGKISLCRDCMCAQLRLAAEVVNGVTALFALEQFNNIHVCLHHNLDPIPDAR